ncbi:hypothetical protein CLG96_11405 [Sphingomonas oleivorans]|uniref:Uncharacterized protein n=1 Tax=Sphingomonas oleivorans TaxID=1735121 RepID=A0A2T5FWW8_9SPHN|nr:hypothetical protein CLG96_11405 [Sphingomonas oleivorans]
MGSHVIGWALDPAERVALLARFPPAYPDIVADHVTLAANTSGHTPLPDEQEGEIVGESDDGAGVQTMIVRIGGMTDRPDGGTYHITWSLDLAKGRRAIQCNDVIRGLGWKRLDEPVPLSLRPARFSP